MAHAAQYSGHVTNALGSVLTHLVVKSWGVDLTGRQVMGVAAS